MKQVNIAIIGCGAVAVHYYAPCLKKLSDAKSISVSVLFDSSKRQAEKLQKLFPEATVLETFSHLSSYDIDLTIIASPVARHAEQSIEAIKLGSAVLCEKPMALNSAQCKTMVEAASQYNRMLAVGHVRRQFPAAQAIKEILERQLLGAVNVFSFNEGSPFQWPAASGALFDKKESGGGVLIDLGVHVLDLLLWWFGDPKTHFYEDDAMGGVEANCNVILEFKNGTRGNVRLSRDWFLNNGCCIHGEKGTLKWDLGEVITFDVISNDHQVIKDIDEIVVRARRECTNEPIHLRAFFDQLQSVIDSIAQKTNLKSVVSGAEALKAIRLIENCYENAQLMEMAWLSESQKERAQLLHQGAIRWIN